MPKPTAPAYIERLPTGRPTGTLVCLSGVNSGAYVFEGATTHLPPHIHLIAFNPPGVGGMPLPLPLTAEKYAELVLQQLHAIPVTGPLIVLGHSMGGFAAQELARLAPERVSKLILVSTCRGQPDIAKDLARMPVRIGMDFWSFQKLVESDPAKAQRHLFGPGFPLREGLRYEWFLQQRKANLPPHSATLAHLTAGGAFSSTAWVNKITCPTLVIHGDADILISLESGQKLAQSIPHARMLGLYGVGHFPMLENPRFWDYVAAFIAGTPLGEEPETPPTFFQRLKTRLWRAG